jgi:ACS family sodium-dependent inorganic phosphate cotransporter
LTCARRRALPFAPKRFLATRTRATDDAASGASGDGTSSDGLPPKDAQRVVLVCALAMLLASADRTIFSLASLAIASDLNLSMTTVGILQSAFLWGYGATQVVGGVAADALGGARVLLFGLLLWSVAVAAIPASAASPFPVATLVAARALFGAASGCAVPAAAAAVAAYVPRDRKSVGLSTVFAAFNCGSAFGLALAGGVIAARGWPSVFTAFGGLGVMWAVAGFALLPEAAKRRKHERTPSTETREETNETKNEDRTGWLDAVLQTPRWLLGQLAALAWCHACVNFGFFQLQSWLPAYMSRDLGFTLGGSGLVAAVPWFVCAAASFFSGKYADAAIENGAPRWRVRRVAMRVATLGPCVSLFSLALLNKMGFLGGSGSATALAVALVACTLATQAVAIAGFHAYLQDVAPARAGAFLGVTNTLGVFAGIAANVATGAILQKTGAFDLVFVVTALVYLSSGLVWEKNMRGKPLFPA